jgi:HEAT repeat protein
MRNRIGISILTGLFLLSGSLTAGAADVAALTKALTGGGEAAHQAADQLALDPAASQAATAALKAALGSDDVELQWRAARALGVAGSSAAGAIAELTKALSAENPKVRGYAAHALGEIGTAAKPASAALAAMLSDKNALVRRAAAHALVDIGPDAEVVLPQVIKILEGSDHALVVQVMATLKEVAQPGVPMLIEALKNEKAQYWGCVLAAELGPKAKAAVGELTKLVVHSEPEVRLQACMALAEIGPDAAAATDALMAALNGDKQTGVRYAAAFALGKMGAKSAISNLQKELHSKDEFLRLVCAFSLAKLQPENAAVVRQAAIFIAKGLTSERKEVRHVASRGLAELDAPAEVTGAALVDALKSADDAVIRNVVAELAQHGAKAVPRLSKALENKELRVMAAMVLARIGADAKGATAALAAAVASSRDDPQFCGEAQFALAAIGPDAAAAIPALIASLSSDHEHIQTTACFALGKMGPAAKDASQEALVALFKDNDGFVRLASAWALMKIFPGNSNVSTRVVPVLVEGLAQHEGKVQLEIISSLGVIGPLAKEALPALQKAAESFDPAVQAAAADAIKKIGA